MSTLVYKAKWRPVRIGWCVRNGDMTGLAQAFRLNHCLWGGRFNPVIIVDDEPLARHMIEVFHVDALLPIGKDEGCDGFVKSVKHLPWPFFTKELFKERGDGRKDCVLLDIYHPVRRFFEQHVKDKPSPKKNAVLYRWADDDPLALVFEATFGNYPGIDISGIDYRDFVVQHAAGKEIDIALTGMVKRGVVRAITANSLTTLGLNRELGAERHESGLFIGDADSFLHLVQFWNLRAAAIDIFFFDLRFATRLGPVKEELESLVRELPPHPNLGPRRLGLWQAKQMDEDAVKSFTVPLGIRPVNEYTWDDRVWMGLKVHPPVMHLSEYSTVAQVSEGGRRPTVTLQVSDKPGFDERPFNGQQLVLTLKPTLNYSREDRFLFFVPFVPELNEYFGREHHFIWNQARAEKDGLGIITHLWTEHLTLGGMERLSFAKQLFKTFGIDAEVSRPGLVCDQLIRQMGGLQGCRVFKIGGVRRLIEQFGPTQDFFWTDAMRFISCDPDKRCADFSAHKHLYIEPRDKASLEPKDAFLFLLKQNVFRVGLKLMCPTCQLPFWRALDEIKTLVTCEYCGREFNITSQLKDDKWAYRPSGLFGRGYTKQKQTQRNSVIESEAFEETDHQESSVPVALTLQQLDTTLHHNFVLWLPAMRLNPLTASIEKCETDFVLLCQDFHGRLEIVIGECKSRGEITEDDVRGLSRVADAFPPDRFDVFIVFSKTGQFTAQEIERCRAADSDFRRRTILLSDRELEPYFVYERAAKEFGINEIAVSLEDMVEATHGIYFEPHPKG